MFTAHKTLAVNVDNLSKIPEKSIKSGIFEWLSTKKSFVQNYHKPSETNLHNSLFLLIIKLLCKGWKKVCLRIKMN